MFIEKRKQGNNIKYYLVHSYRVGKKIKRVSRYLGSNLSEKKLKKLRTRAEDLLKEQIKNKHLFKLTDDELKEYKKYEKKIEIAHLQKTLDWEQFTKDFVYNTNAIEGSAVEYKEVEDLIDKKEKPENLDEVETLNVAQAVEFIRRTKEPFSLSLIKKLHKQCFSKTKSFAGKLRDIEVVIRNPQGGIIHKGAPAKKLESLLKNLVKWYNQHKNKYPSLLLAAIIHNQFEHIHPFQDGNGRVGRLLLNYILLKHNYPPLNIRLENRREYYKTLRIFDKTGNIKPTIRFFIKEYRRGLQSK